MSDFAARAARYCQRVVTGEVVACHWVRQACLRQQADLQRTASEDWPWEFDATLGERVCTFIECLPHIKGRWSTPTIVLEDWQCFILCVVFGWVHRQTRARRFRIVYVEVPRKNAKSTITAGAGLYCLAADGEMGGEVYAAATTGAQARIVFDVAKEMVRQQPRLAQQFGIGHGEHALFVRNLAATFKPLNAESGTLDGLNVSFGAVDELHAHKKRGLWDVITTATGSRVQPLIWAITTAGSDRAGVCYEQRDYVKKILDGVVRDDTYFGIVYTIDEGDDWTDERVWAKANPNLGVSVSIDDLRSKCQFALTMPSAQSNFLTKHLDVWVNADAAFMDMQAWDACADRSLRVEQFEGCEVIAGLDLASKVDVASKALVFERGGEYYAFCKHYLPERAIEISRNSQYEGWRRRGLLTVTEGEVTDYDVIEDDLRADADRFELKEAGFDPHQATQLVGHLLRDGLPMVEVRPTVLNFSEPMKLLEALVLQGKFHHDGDEVLAWMVSNVVCHRDAKDNIYPRKEREENKIDGVVAILTALNRHIALREAEPEPALVVL